MKNKKEKKEENKEAKGRAAAFAKELQEKMAESIVAAGEKHSLRLERTNPERAMEVLEHYALGGSMRKTMAAFGVSKDALRRMAWDHKEVLKDWRKYAAGEAFLLKTRVQDLMQVKMDRMEEDESQIDKTNLRDFAQAVSMMNETYMAAMGEGQKIGVGVTVNVGPTFEDVQRHLQELREKIARESGSKKFDVGGPIVDV